MENPWEALGALVQTMFATSTTTWVHAPWFGLYEFVSDFRNDGDDIRDALNEALRELGITWAAVSSLRVKNDREQGERLFDLEFVGADPQDGSHNVAF